MFTLGFRDVRDTPLDLHQGLVGVLFLVQLPDSVGSHRLLQGRRENRDDTREPRSDVGHKGELERRVKRLGEELRKSVGRFSFVDVVSQCVGSDSALQVLRALQRKKSAWYHAAVVKATNDLGNSLRSTMFVILASFRTSTTVSGDAKDRGRVRRIDVRHQGGEKHLGVGSVTSGV